MDTRPYTFSFYPRVPTRHEYYYLTLTLTLALIFRARLFKTAISANPRLNRLIAD